MRRNTSAAEGRDKKPRAPIPRAVETRLLLESRRRCCLCAFLSGDLSQKQVQIAHISHDRDDSRYENLVVLCLDHHDQYDSSTSQSKGFTPDEVRHYKARLEDLIRRWDHAPHQVAVPYALAGDLTVGTMSIQSPQPSPVPSSGESCLDMDAFPLLRTLLDPSLEDQARTTLVGNDFLSEEIDDIETVVVQAKLNPDVGRPYCVVSIGSLSGWTWDVLVLSYRAGKWSRLGRIPLPGQKGYKPVIAYVPGETTGAIGLEHVAIYGTGVFQKATTWYRVEADRIVPLLTYPLRAYVVGWGMPFQRHITGQTSQIPWVIEPGSRMEILLTTEYSADPSWLRGKEIEEELPLFSVSSRLILEWDVDARVFVPTKDSTATFEQVEGLFNDGTDMFTRRYVREIVNLVRKGGSLELDWVKHLVEHSPRSPECKRVKSALDAASPR